MKTCSKCREIKSTTEFNRNAGRKDGLQTFCRDCSKSEYKKYYQGNPKEKDRLIKSNKVSNAKKLEWLRSLKDIPCKDCGQTFPPYVMDFDHLGDKEFGIASYYIRYGREKLIKEMAKCEVVCANCHRIRTFERLYRVAL